MQNYNLGLVFVSYVLAVIGSFMALYITRTALRKPDNRNGLLFFASVCLGGVGIWSMHFVGMLALNMEDMAMNFNWGLTALSFIAGVLGVYAGLAVMGHGELKIPKLVMAGFLVGTAVCIMHYTGMWAMQMQADIQWNMTIVGISIAIAVVASIVALWLALNVKKMWQIIASALVMGIAVCGMHYTGMAAATYVANLNLPEVEPLAASAFFFTFAIATIDIVIVFIGMVVAMAESNRQEQKLQSQM